MTAKKATFFVMFFVLSFFLPFASNGQQKSSLTFQLKNNSSLVKKDIIVDIGLNDIKKKLPDFSTESYIIMAGDDIVPAEEIKDFSNGSPALLLSLSFLPQETKTVNVVKAQNEIPKLTKRTQAYLGQKHGFQRVDKYYRKGYFKSVGHTKMPNDHFAHDALYQFEGPGWESDKIAYRFYLDDRNRTDIFGKTIPDVVLNKVGIDDLDSGNEGYQNPQPWGMDIFKVNNSLGIGSISTLNDGKVITIAKTDSTVCDIVENGNLFSKIRTQYYGWNTGKNKYDLTADISIEAGSRLTKNELYIKGDLDNICTGLAKHDSTELIKSSADKSGWGYLALYGVQARSGDNLGLVIFYKNSAYISSGNDAESYYITLKPEEGKVTYYFAAAWQQEPNGIKNKEDFLKYLEQTKESLESDITVSFL